MKSNLEKANQALLDGDRDGVLRLLRNESETPEVIWLRANSILSNEERLRLLEAVARGDSRYAPLAEETLNREAKFQSELDEPPDYKFWAQPNYKKRMEKMREYRLWIFGGILLIVTGIFGVIININYESAYEKQVANVRATQTAQAFFAGKQFAQYAEGSLSIVNVMNDVDAQERPVTAGDTADDQFKPLTPAEGAHFIAVQVSFQCTMPVCNEPPQASLALLLSDDKVTQPSDYSSHLFFIDEPPSESDRIASGRSVKLWFVFEAPRTTSPKALLVFAPNEQEPQIVSWPVR